MAVDVSDGVGVEVIMPVLVGMGVKEAVWLGVSVTVDVDVGVLV